MDYSWLYLSPSSLVGLAGTTTQYLAQNHNV